MAVALDRMGVASGARVAIVSPNSARFVIALFGVSAYGRVLVPINFRLNAEEVGYVVRHSGADVLLVDPEFDDALAEVTAAHRLRLDGIEDADLFAPTDDMPAPWEPDEDATASINYTSGTTARPKGVQLTHRTLWLHAASVGWHLGVSDRDVYLQAQPLFHCNGWGLPYALTAMGARQVMLRRVDGPEILSRIAQHGVTLTCGAPAVLDAVLRANAADGGDAAAAGAGRMRMLVGGAPPPTTTIQRVEEELGWEFMHGYGLTESSPVLTVNRASPEDDALTPAERARRLARQGPPVVGVRLRVDGQGEVLARSNHVLASYWDDPAATAAAIDGGWLHTGDGGVIDAENHLDDHRPQEGRHPHRRGERLVDRGRGLPPCPPRRARGGGDRRALGALGGDRQGARRGTRGGRRGRGGPDRLRPRAARPLQVPHLGGAAREPAAHRHREDPEVPPP